MASGRHRAKNTPSQTTRNGIFAGALAAIGIVAITPEASAVPVNDWDKLAACESSSDWHINTGTHFTGGVQILDSTWDAYGGTAFAPRAYQATKSQQIQVAERILAGQGWNAWPVCSKKAGVRGEVATPNTDVEADATVEAAPPITRTEVPERSVDTYTVRDNDTLSEIAQDNGTTWQHLAQLNTDVISDPNLIFPHQTIKLT